MKTDFQSEMEKETEHIKSTGKKPVLLLQCCCAPCSSAVLERLKEYFTLKLYFYNPNIYPESEYYKRLEQFGKLLGNGEFAEGITLLDSQYEPEEFFSRVKGLENEKEGGERCTECFKLRLEETAKKAKETGAEYFCTTLSVSPHKNARLLNEIKRSTELSRELGLYRQNYCGCKFSIWFE